MNLLIVPTLSVCINTSGVFRNDYFLWIEYEYECLFMLVNM